MERVIRKGLVGIAALTGVVALSAGAAGATPSANGNGNGLAVGRPEAGSVGNADFRTPGGQTLDGSDANAGYECDTNAGVGRTNPAHSGCEYSGGSGGEG